MTKSKLYSLIIFLIVNYQLLIINCLYAGPPFNTDDPEPVPFRHWEFYLASINMFSNGASQGTLPHFEMNYGVVKNVQLHCVIPLNYNYTAKSEINTQNNFNYGYGNTELGVKYRFIKEDDNAPQVGIFPVVEVPSSNVNQFTNGKIQVLLPVWIQKSFGKFTTYGGGGYWYNPGTGNRNWYFIGAEGQYEINKTFTVGGELFYHSSQTTDNTSSAFFNLGGFINFSESLHFIFSAGHCINRDSQTIAYAGLLFTI